MELDIVTEGNWTFHYKKGTQVLHNPDGPAAFYRVNGVTSLTTYYLNGKRDRKDGPACIANSVEVYFRNGLPHNQNGPAVIWKGLYSYREPEYYLKGVELTQEEWEIQRKLL